MNSLTFRLVLPLYIILTLFLAGCGMYRPKTDPALDKEALSLSTRIKAINNSIHTSKGSGWIKIETEDKKEKYRIAWAGQFPDKIRITFLSSGIPVETVTANGEKITFYSHTGSHALHSYEAEDADMGKYLQVPVRMSRIISMLLGRYPLADFDDAYYQPGSPDKKTIALLDTGQNRMQSLSLRQDGTPEEIAIHDFAGTPLYRFRILAHKTFENTSIPSDIEVRDRLGRKLHLNITGFSPNPSLKEGIFQLTESLK